MTGSQRRVDINGEDEDGMIEHDLVETPDETAKERRKRRKQEALKEQLNAYLKKQDKFAGAMHNILVEHK